MIDRRINNRIKLNLNVGYQNAKQSNASFNIQLEDDCHQELEEQELEDEELEDQKQEQQGEAKIIKHIRYCCEHTYRYI